MISIFIFNVQIYLEGSTFRHQICDEIIESVQNNHKDPEPDDFVVKIGLSSIGYRTRLLATTRANIYINRTDNTSKQARVKKRAKKPKRKRMKSNTRKPEARKQRRQQQITVFVMLLLDQGNTKQYNKILDTTVICLVMR